MVINLALCDFLLLLNMPIEIIKTKNLNHFPDYLKEKLQILMKKLNIRIYSVLLVYLACQLKKPDVTHDQLLIQSPFNISQL